MLDPNRALARLLSGLGLVALFSVVPSCQSGDSDEDRQRPNILLISIDTLRPDHMGIYGYGFDTTPRLDELAKDGVLFRDVFAPRGSTWPSLTSLMTGKFPINHGILFNGAQLDARQITLPEILKSEGYETGAFLSNFYDAPNRGFDRVVAETNPMQPMRAWDAANVERALEWLEEKKDARTFTWVHLMDPHSPYDPVPEQLERFAGDYDGWLAPFVPLDELRGMAAEGRAPISEAQIDEYLSYRENGVPRAQTIQSNNLQGQVPLHYLMEMITLFELDISDADLAYIIANYDAQIPPADALLGQVLDKIDELGLRENTLVIFTTDHGDDLFEHNHYFFHGSSIYDGTLRVAWTMRWPGVLGAGRVIEGPQAPNVDMMPTILELIGISPPRGIDGVSAAGMLLGEGSYEPGPVVYQWYPNPEPGDANPFDEASMFAWRTADWKLIDNPESLRPETPPYHLAGTERAYQVATAELYDLRTDPDEQEDLLGVHELDLEEAGIDQRVKAVEGLLERLRLQQGYTARLRGWAEEQLSKPRPTPGIGDMGPIRSLGYVGGAQAGPESSRLSRQVREAMRATFDAIEDPAAEHFALLAEAQWLDGDRDVALRTIEQGLEAFVGDEQLKRLRSEVRAR